MNKLLLPIAVGALGACGFHLKGSFAHDHLPVQKWQITGAQLQQPLETALRQASGSPVSAKNAQAELRLTGYDTKRATAQAYRNGHPWGAPLVAEVRRPMPYSDGLALGKDEETETIWRDMQNDAAAQLVRQLGFLNRQPAPETQSK